MDIGQTIALTAFIVMLVAATVAGMRMWHLRQQRLAVVCGAIAAFIFALGFWYLTTTP
ncbi:MAG: hypothetical protein QM589_18350 [Thermomicrobiales bacterium]